MALAPGTRLGPYEILGPLGAGGMGEVYKSTDTRLGRTVAIKILPAHVAVDPQLKRRFEQEARTLASLSHPHICPVFDVGSQDGIDFLVMEYLEGMTLAERLQKAPLSIDLVLEYASEMADALDKAHRQGITHRDLKPGNVMITRSGATLLDFGLAKLRPGAILPSTVSHAQTGSRELTAQGTILGTLQYMAPEQLEGHDADARTDIFAFGTILYEMATGRRAFEGKSQVGLIAAILEHEPPPIITVRPVSPAILSDIARLCLAKSPDDRWQSAADLLHALKLAATSSASPPNPVRAAKVRERVAWAAVAVLVLALGITIVWSRSNPREPMRVVFDLDPDVRGPGPLQFDLSPDGTRFVHLSPEGLSIRRLDDVSSQIVPGTTEASAPFWSADSRFIGFFSSGKLRKVDVRGSPPEPLADVQGIAGGTWNRAGVIVFAPTPNGPLFRIPAEGGSPVQVTTLNQSREEISHRWPKFLPDGVHFLFFAASRKPEYSGIYIGTLGTNEVVTRLIATDVMGLFAPPDHVLFLRENTLMAQRFDTRSLRLEGDAFPIAEDVATNPTNRRAGIAVSDTGALVYLVGAGTGTGDRLLQWADRAGNTLDVVARGDYLPLGGRPVGSDGEQVVVKRTDGNSDLWILEPSRGGTGLRFTDDPAEDGDPLWSPVTSSIVFRSNREGRSNLYVKDAAGVQPEELLVKTDNEKIPEDWSQDGLYLSYSERSPTGPWDMWILPMSGDRRPFRFLGMSFSEDFGRFSPDVRWIAYRSNETGRSEIYVQSFPTPTRKYPISNGGGVDPKWRQDGRELFYRTRSGDVANVGAIWAVDVDATRPNSLSFGVPRKLFETSSIGFHPSPDGQRFLLNLPATSEAENRTLRVELNWMSGRQQERDLR